MSIEVIPGNKAPHYQGQELVLEGTTITEQGTQEGLPLVDFRMRDQHGNLFLLVLTGRIVNTLSAAIKGINEKNHGNPEP
jgi:hypothetical protein